MRSTKLTLGIGMLVLATMACGNSAQTEVPRKVEPDAASAPAEDAGAGEATAARPETFAVGDTVALSDHQITLESASRNGDKLLAVFVVENTGSKDISISSLMSFEAKDQDGNKGQSDIFVETDTGGLDGTVLPGDKLRGHVAWSGLGDGVRIHYTPGLLDDRRVIWEVAP